MSSSQRGSFLGLIAVHSVLAIAPLMAALLFRDFPDLRLLPIIWALYSIPFSQIMLLSVWVGMVSFGNFLPRVLLAAIATALLAAWITAGRVYGPANPPESTATHFFQVFALLLAITAVLSAAVAGTSRLVGTISFTRDTSDTTEPRFHFSVFALLVVLTATALVLGLVRASRIATASGQSETVSYMLAVVVFALNMLTTIWATLGAGHVKRRLLAVFLVSIVLGFSMYVGVGNSPHLEPWWLFASGSLIVVVPTAIVACTLLWLRWIGYRLVAPQTKLGPDSY